MSRSHVRRPTSWRITAGRLVSQQIEQPRQTSAAALVRWMGAVQGQDYLGGLWTLGLRLPSRTDKDVESAFLHREIHRTWALRGTLHFVAASDIHWMLDLQGARQIARNARRFEELELDEETMRRSNEILVGALQGRTRTRKELLRTLEREGISTKGQRAPYLLQRACLDRLICQGVTKRNDPTYMILGDPPGKPPSREEAAAELAKRYFFSHGPATVADFIWWSGLPAAEARSGLEAVRHMLRCESFDGGVYWMHPTVPELAADSSRVHLLSSFDEYLVSYRSRDAAIGPEDARVPLIGKPTVIIGGRVVGTWKRVLKKDNVIVHTSLFRDLSRSEQRGVEHAVGRFGRFLQKEAQWQA